MNLNMACITDRGNYRSKNQDRIICRRKATEDGALAVACVCDGIGSFDESEIASEMMINGIASWFDGIVKYYPRVMDKDSLMEDLELTIRELNDLVCEYRENNKIDIGCTMSLMLMIDYEYYILHVGDSKIYCLRDMLFQMTQDEVILKMIEGREKTLLINYIGKSCQLRINKQRGFVKQGDVYLLGSDGLYKKLIYEDVVGLQNYIGGDKELDRVCVKLLHTVLERGERDNISCAILQVV